MQKECTCNFCGVEIRKLGMAIRHGNIAICADCIDICDEILEDEGAKRKSVTQDEIKCSFCGRPTSDCTKMIAGPNNTYVCDVCVEYFISFINGDILLEELIDNNIEDNLDSNLCGTSANEDDFPEIQSDDILESINLDMLDGPFGRNSTREIDDSNIMSAAFNEYCSLLQQSHYQLTDEAKQKASILLLHGIHPNELFKKTQINQANRLVQSGITDLNMYSIVEASDIQL